MVVGGYSSYCSNPNNNCPFEFLLQQTPTMTSIVQAGTNLIISGTGFGSTGESNIVLIGDKGSCDITAANVTSIACTISNSPSGEQKVQVNVVDKGFAINNANTTVTVPLTITSFQPSEGPAGGGFILTINGTGFSADTMVLVGEQFCIDAEIAKFSFISCTAPPFTSGTGHVNITVIDGMQSITANSVFFYNVTQTPMISSIEPDVVMMGGGLMNITGTGFGDNIGVVLIGTTNALILSSSSNQIQINLPKLPPGRYPITVKTSAGVALSPVPIEYQFYIQAIVPQVGSLNGGNEIDVFGQGFDNLTSINLRDENNRTYPCEVMTVSSDRIRCRTSSSAQERTITANGTYPDYGFGSAWSPARAIIEPGTRITWNWNGSDSTRNRTYRVQQVVNAYSTDSVTNGFDSGPATAIGEHRLMIHRKYIIVILI